MPSARRAVSAITAPIPSQTAEASTPSGVNAGRRTRSVTRPRAIVTATEPIAYMNAPTTATANGRGCIRTYETTRRTPRPNRSRGTSPPSARVRSVRSTSAVSMTPSMMRDGVVSRLAVRPASAMSSHGRPHVLDGQVLERGDHEVGLREVELRRHRVRDAEARDACRLRRADPVGRVLDREGLGRRDPEDIERRLVQVRVRLGARGVAVRADHRRPSVRAAEPLEVGDEPLGAVAAHERARDAGIVESMQECPDARAERDLAHGLADPPLG